MTAAEEVWGGALARGETLYVPPAYVPSATLGERIRYVGAAVRETRSRAVLGVLVGVSAVAFLVALAPVSAHGTDRAGPFVARCGVEYAVLGSQNAVVTQVCGAAYAVHLTVLAWSAAVFVTAGAALLAAVLASRGNRFAFVVTTVAGCAVRTPGRAALATVAATTATIGALALVSVTVYTGDSLGPLTARCGIDVELFGAGHHALRSACRGVYSGHATVAAVCGAAFLATFLLLAGLVRTDLARWARATATEKAPEGTEAT